MIIEFAVFKVVMFMGESKLLRSYREDLNRDGFEHDPAQEAVVKKLDQLFGALIDLQSQSKPKSVFGQLAEKYFSKERPVIRGVYIWGSVGTGKTYVMDKFYSNLPLQRKARMHFHRFMRQVHAELTTLQGVENPLIVLGNRWAEEFQLICLDEFYVSDITDAMILGELLKALLQAGVVLVATSNVAPADLYKDGLQRARFLPAIDTILSYTDVITLNARSDFRLRSLEQAQIYHSPLGEEAESLMMAYFKSLVLDNWQKDKAVQLDGRPVQALLLSDDVVWFDFENLCGGPRSQRDYIEIAMVYHAVLLSDIPILTTKVEDKARRFISLIDELYDRGVKLIISAAAPIESLYQGSRLTFEFERTQSRLIEMQSHEYLAKPHRP